MAKIERATMRELVFKTDVNPYATGSVEVSFGQTKVLCTASVEESVPPFLRDKNVGWLTAEYYMLPMSTHTRSRRDKCLSSGRTHEIQRLIGRSLRAVVDLSALGPRTLMIDCDVLVADGGTRTASITGAFLAMALAVKKLKKEGRVKEEAKIILDYLAAVSVGLREDGGILVDLNYQEDSSISTDMNIVMTKAKKIVEVQAAAEKVPFTSQELQLALEAGEKALSGIFKKMEEILL